MVKGGAPWVARQQGFDYERATVRLSLRVNRASGPLDPGERELGIVKISAQVTAQRASTEEQQRALSHGVETCPVDNTPRRGLTLVDTVEFTA